MMAPSCEINHIHVNNQMPPPSPPIPELMYLPLSLLEKAFGNCEVKLTRCDNDPRLSPQNRIKLQRIKSEPPENPSETLPVLSSDSDAKFTSISFKNCPYSTFKVVLVQDQSINEGWVHMNGSEPVYYVNCNNRLRHIEVPPPIKTEDAGMISNEEKVLPLARKIKIRRSNGSYSCEYCRMRFTRRYSAYCHQLRSCTANGFSIATIRKLKAKRTCLSQIPTQPLLPKSLPKRPLVPPPHEFDSKVDEPLDIKPDMSISSQVAQMVKNSTFRVKSQNQRTHRCSTCGQTFTRRDHLKSHVLTVHLKLKPFQCNLCRKTFRRSDHVKKHIIAVHTKERPHACQKCDKRFASRSNLNSHLQWHSGVRPFLCTICLKKFFRRYDLLCHLRVHTGEKPYECYACGKRFSKTPNLKKHIQRMHSRKMRKNLTEVPEDPDNSLIDRELEMYLK